MYSLRSNFSSSLGTYQPFTSTLNFFLDNWGLDRRNKDSIRLKDCPFLVSFQDSFLSSHPNNENSPGESVWSSTRLRPSWIINLYSPSRSHRPHTVRVNAELQKYVRLGRRTSKEGPTDETNKNEWKRSSDGVGGKKIWRRTRDRRRV